MAHHRKLTAWSLLLAVFFPQFILLSSNRLEKEFNYEEDSQVGPAHWGRLHKDWEACRKGRMQSPIDLADQRAQILPHHGGLRRHYRPAPAVLKNREHDFMLQWEGKAAGAGALWINGTKYNLKQLHWHSPSEHTINGRRYSMEMHMVHESAEKKIAVVGSLYRAGGRNHSDPFLRQLEEYLKRIAGRNGEEEFVGMVDPRDINHGTRRYYRYMGSLTTPPCTEGVVWTIMRKVKKVPKEQLQLLRRAVRNGFQMNARPMQRTDDRMIDLFM